MAVVRTHRQIADCNQTARAAIAIGMDTQSAELTVCLFSLLTTETSTNKVREELLARDEDINSKNKKKEQTIELIPNRAEDIHVYLSVCVCVSTGKHYQSLPGVGKNDLCTKAFSGRRMHW